MFRSKVIKVFIAALGFFGPLLFAEKKSSHKKHHSKHSKKEDHKDHTRCSCSRKKKNTAAPANTGIKTRNLQDYTAHRAPLPNGNFQSLGVAGSSKVGNDLTVGNDLLVGEKIITANLLLKDDLQAGGTNTCDQPGFLNVQGDAKFSSGLRVGQNTSAHIVNTTILTTEKESCGSLAVNGSENIQSVTVAANTQVGGTLFTDKIDPLNKQTITFEDNVSIASSKKLLVNEINPVDCSKTSRITENESISKALTSNPQCNDSCPLTCLQDDTKVLKMSGNVAIHPEKTLLVNDIEPITKDREGNYLENAQNDAYTSFSGNVAISKTLLANEINPTMIDCREIDMATTYFNGNVGINPGTPEEPRTLYTNMILPTQYFGVDEDDVSYYADYQDYYDNYEDYFHALCPFTTFSGCVSIKKHHIFGQLDYRGIDPITNQPIPLNFNSLPLGSQGFQYPITECAPVLRLTFNNSRENFNNNSTKLPYGAWVKLDVSGIAQINYRGEEKDNSLFIDIFTELYFFVGPGDGSHSAFVGTLNGINFNNTLSGRLCDKNFGGNLFRSTRNSLRACINPADLAKVSQGSLFGIVPTALNALSAPAILGTPVTSSAHPKTVDILLMGLLAFNNSTEFNFNQADYNYELKDILDPACPFSLKDLTVYYEIISPNIESVCFPDPKNLFDESIYEKACTDLITTFSTCEYLAPNNEQVFVY